MAQLPILMYHNVSKLLNESKGLTIAVEILEDHFKFLNKNGYQTVHFSELEVLKQKDEFPKKAVIITFDDVYVNQQELAYPLLKKYGLKASFFIPLAYVSQKDAWNTNIEDIMSVEQLNTLDPNIIELGLHSFNHNRYDELSNEAIVEDFEKCKAFIKKNNLNVNNILAYPYGKFPRKEPKRTAFFNILKTYDIAYGLRIGNRVNRFPLKNKYEIQRIDIKGEDSLIKFRLKLRFGKLKLF